MAATSGWSWLRSGLPCWVLLVLTPARAGPRAGTGPAQMDLADHSPIGRAAAGGGRPGAPASSPPLRQAAVADHFQPCQLSGHPWYWWRPFPSTFALWPSERPPAGPSWAPSFVDQANLTVDREHAHEAVQDSRRIEERLLKGTPVHLFPEGTFTHASGLRPFQMGAFKLAADTGSLLLPVTLRGTRRVLRDGRLLPSPAPLRVVIGAAIQPRGKGWPEMIRLRDAAHAEVLKHCGEGPLDLVLAGPPRAGSE